MYFFPVPPPVWKPPCPICLVCFPPSFWPCFLLNFFFFLKFHQDMDPFFSTAWEKSFVAFELVLVHLFLNTDKQVPFFPLPNFTFSFLPSLVTIVSIIPSSFPPFDLVSSMRPTPIIPFPHPPKASDCAKFQPSHLSLLFFRQECLHAKTPPTLADSTELVHSPPHQWFFSFFCPRPPLQDLLLGYPFYLCPFSPFTRKFFWSLIISTVCPRK